MSIQGHVYWLDQAAWCKGAVEDLSPAKDQILFLARDPQQVLDGKPQEEKGAAGLRPEYVMPPGPRDYGSFTSALCLHARGLG
jgi:hypothetical protein